MPRLTPTDLVLVNKVLEAGENQAPKDLVKKDLEIALEKHQMTTDSCLEVLSQIMHYSRKENNKIAVAKLGLEMSGALKKEEEKLPEDEKDKTPIIQFVFQDSNVNINPMLNPRR